MTTFMKAIGFAVDCIALLVCVAVFSPLVLGRSSEEIYWGFPALLVFGIAASVVLLILLIVRVAIKLAEK